MKKLLGITLGILLYFSCTSQTVTYYFASAANGGSDANNGRSGTVTGSGAGPFLSVAKFNTLFATGGSVNPGDNILFHRGDTWNGTLNLQRSGTLNNNIVIADYGSGAKPLFTNMVTVGGFSNGGTGFIYTSNSTGLGSIPATLNVVVKNGGVPMKMGRWPNTGYNIMNNTTTTTFQDGAITRSWVGAKAVVRGSAWTLNPSPVTGYNASTRTITFTSLFGKPVAEGYGYFIQGDIGTLDLNDEWYWNSVAKTLSYYSNTGTPTGITVPGQDYTITMSGSFITFSNIAAQYSNLATINVSGGSHDIYINNCDVAYSGITGIEGGTSGKVKITGGTIFYSMNFGFNSSGSRNRLDGVHIHDNGWIAGHGQPGDDQGWAVNLDGGNNFVTRCEIDSVGAIGINFGNNDTCIHNFVHEGEFIKDDSGAFYCLGTTGAVIDSNIIINMFGAPVGSGNNQGVSASAVYCRNCLGNRGSGIYSDDHTTGNKYRGNFIYNTGANGFYLHNTQGAVVSGNTVFGAATAALTITRDGLANNVTPHDVIRNLVITGNKFISKGFPSYDYMFTDSTNIFGNWSSAFNFNNNIVAKPLNQFNGTNLSNSSGANAVVKTLTTGPGLANPNTYHSLASWRANYVFDAVSTGSQLITTDTTNFFKVIYNPSDVAQAVSLPVNYKDVAGASYSNSVVLQPWTSLVLMVSGGVVVPPPARTYLKGKRVTVL